MSDEKTNNEILAMLVDKTKEYFHEYMDKQGLDAAYWSLEVDLKLSDLSSDSFKPLRTSQIKDSEI